MRLAIVSEWYQPRRGGIELFLAELTARLQAAGETLDVFTPTPGPASIAGVPITRLGPPGGYRFSPAPSASNGQDFLFQLSLLGGPRPRALEQLKTALAVGRYDAVHVHMGNTPFTYLAVNLCVALGLPVVATFHAMLSPLEQPLFALGSRLLGCDRWPNRVVLTAVSSAAATARRPMFGPAPFAILPNAIDSAYWSALRTSRPPRPPNARLEIVAALRLHPRKRPLLLLDALRTLPPSLGVHLSIAGEGPLRAALEQRIAALDLGDRITLCGQQPRAALAELLARADLFAMPTRHESFGIAGLEARTAGVPVLAMQSAGARDFLTPGLDCLLAEDDRAFTEALHRFATDSTLRTQLAAGAATPLPGHDWADIVALCRRHYAAARTLVR